MRFKLQTILALLLAVLTIVPAWAEEVDSAALVATLQSSDATLHAKAVACKQLAFYGDTDAVPVLASLLPDEKLSHYARFSLEGIPDPSAAKALRDAAATLTGRQLVGVVGSLGSIRDAEAVELLGSLLKNEDVDVAMAAASSLGKIANEAALAAIGAYLDGGIRDDKRFKFAMADALAELSEQAVRNNNPQLYFASVNSIMKVYPSSQEIPTHVKAAFGRSMVLAVPSSGHVRLKDLLLRDNPEEVEIGLGVARELKTAEAAEMLVSLYEEASTALKIQLVRFYGEMGADYPLFDERVVRLIEAVGAGDSPALRFEAVKALAALGDVIPEDSPAIDSLFGLIGSDDDVLKKVSIDTLSQQSSKAIDAKLLTLFESADLSVDEQCATIELIGRRRIASVAPRLAELATSASVQAVRHAAVRALGETVAQSELGRMIDLYAAFQGDDESAAVYKESVQAAIIRMPDQNASVDRMIAAMSGKPEEVQVFILDRIGELGGPAALAQLKSLAISGEPHHQDAATRILGGWMMTDGAPVLLEIAKTHPAEKYRIRTLRGFIRIVRQLRFSDEERLANCLAALEVAVRPDEKLLVLETLTRIKNVDSMRVALAYLSDPQLKGRAAVTIVALVGPISEKEPQAALAALKQVLAASVNENVAHQARLLVARIEQRQ